MALEDEEEGGEGGAEGGVVEGTEADEEEVVGRVAVAGVKGGTPWEGWIACDSGEAEACVRLTSSLDVSEDISWITEQ